MVDGRTTFLVFYSGASKQYILFIRHAPDQRSRAPPCLSTVECYVCTRAKAYSTLPLQTAPTARSARVAAVGLGENSRCPVTNENLSRHFTMDLLKKLRLVEATNSSNCQPQFPLRCPFFLFTTLIIASNDD